MRLYQFHFFDIQGGYPTLELAHLEGDDDALVAASGLLVEHASAAGVDIYDIDRLVAHMPRGAEAGASSPGS